MAFARLYLRVLGALTLLTGLAYVLAPAALTTAAGFGELTGAGTTDVRATYGGFQIGLGGFLLWCAAAPARVRPALVATALSIGAIGLSRALGLVLDDSVNGFHRAGLVTEMALTALTLFAFSRVEPEAPAAP